MSRDCHSEGQSVTDAAIARDWAEILEEREARRAGVSRAEARPIVARKTGVPEGKLYSLRRNRLKDFPRYLLQRLGQSVIRELEAELRQVEHDLQTLTQIGAHPDSGETLSLLSSRRKIREALGLSPDGAA